MISPTIATLAGQIHDLAKIPRAQLVDLLGMFDGDVLEDFAAALERVLKEVADREDCDLAQKVVAGEAPSVRTLRELERRRQDRVPFTVELRNTGGGRSAFYRITGHYENYANYAWSTQITFGKIGTTGKTIDGRGDHAFEKIKEKLREGYDFWNGGEE